MRPGTSRPHTGEATYSPATFDPASAYFYYLTNDGSEFTRVRRYALAAGTHEDVEKADWDIASFGFSRARHLPRHGRQRGRALCAAHRARRPRASRWRCPRFPTAASRAVSFSRSEKRLAFTLNGDRSPSDLYTLTIGQGAPAAHRRRCRRTSTPADLVDTQVVRFKSFDGMAIPNILLQAAPGHGERQGAGPRLGPWRSGRADAPRLQRHHQYLANHGYVVLGHQQPGQLGLRQVVLRGGRPEARPRAALGLRRGQEVPREPALRGRRPHRHHRRQLRRLHGARRARLQARGVRRGRGHLRRVELAADAREHPGVVGGAAQGALRRDRRSGRTEGDAARDLAGPARRPDPQAADRASRAPTIRASSRRNRTTSSPR